MKGRLVLFLALPFFWVGQVLAVPLPEYPSLRLILKKSVELNLSPVQGKTMRDIWKKRSVKINELQKIALKEQREFLQACLSDEIEDEEIILRGEKARIALQSLQDYELESMRVFRIHLSKAQLKELQKQLTKTYESLSLPSK